MTKNKNATGKNRSQKVLAPEQKEILLKTLKTRFEKNRNRHKGIEWSKVETKLNDNAEKLWCLNRMEETGGEPDVVSYDKKKTNTFSLIARRKVRKAAEAFVTIGKDSNPERNIARKTARSTWRFPWELNC